MGQRAGQRREWRATAAIIALGLGLSGSAALADGPAATCSATSAGGRVLIDVELERFLDPDLLKLVRLGLEGNLQLELVLLRTRPFWFDELFTLWMAGGAFMIVRHPMQRLISEYRHSRKLGRIDSRLPFNSWAQLMLNIASIGPHYSNNHYRPQNEFHCFDAEVFRFEEGLPSILARVVQQIGIPGPGVILHEKKSSLRVTRISAAVYFRVQQRYAATSQRSSMTFVCPISQECRQ